MVDTHIFFGAHGKLAEAICRENVLNFSTSIALYLLYSCFVDASRLLTLRTGNKGYVGYRLMMGGVCIGVGFITVFI